MKIRRKQDCYSEMSLPPPLARFPDVICVAHLPYSPAGAESAAELVPVYPDSALFSGVFVSVKPDLRNMTLKFW
jgi:hypothetical protein